MKCIRVNCRRATYRGMALCRDCLDCIVHGRPPTCATPTPSARPGGLAGRVRPTAPLSPLEVAWLNGDR
jgi:hypothetical protein